MPRFESMVDGFEAVAEEDEIPSGRFLTESEVFFSVPDASLSATPRPVTAAKMPTQATRSGNRAELRFNVPRNCGFVSLFIVTISPISTRHSNCVREKTYLTPRGYNRHFLAPNSMSDP